MRAKALAPWTGVALIVLAPAARAERIPAFARMHRASCSLCHDPIPRLSAFGEMFVANGYRFAPDQPPPDRMPTGDPLLQLPARLRLAMRLDAYATAYANGNVATDFQTPYYLRILSGGPLTEHLSYFMYFMLSERGETGGIEDAYVTWSNLAGLPLSVSVGQFQMSDPIFARELRLEYQDYAIYGAHIGSSPVSLTYDRGIMLGADLAGFAITGEMVNGNGGPASQANGRLDDDHNKSFLGHVRREVAPGVTLGVMGYLAHQQGAANGGPTAQDRVTMLGGDAHVELAPVTLSGQFIHREDTSPTFTLNEPTAITNGGFGEVLLHPTGARWYAIGLYNLIHTNRPLLDLGVLGGSGLSRYETVTGGAGYLLQRNVRVYGEATWDRELHATQWTAGFTIAF